MNNTVYTWLLIKQKPVMFLCFSLTDNLIAANKTQKLVMILDNNKKIQQWTRRKFEWIFMPKKNN